MSQAKQTIVGAMALLVALAAASVLVLSGCGDKSTPADSFEGTWRSSQSRGAGTSYGPQVVIAKTQGGYLCTIVYSNGFESPSPPPTFAIALTRQGDRLTGTAKLTTGDAAVEFVYAPDTDRLIFTYTRKSSPSPGPGESTELTRLSDSTAIPSVSP